MKLPSPLFFLVVVSAFGCGGSVDLGGKPAGESKVTSALCGPGVRVLAESAGTPGSLVVAADAVVWSVTDPSGMAQVPPTSIRRVSKSDGKIVELTNEGMLESVRSGGAVTVAAGEAVYTTIEAKGTYAIKGVPITGGPPRAILQRESDGFGGVAAGSSRVVWAEFREWRSEDLVYSYFTMPLAGGTPTLLDVGLASLDIAILDEGVAWLVSGGNGSVGGGPSFRFVPDAQSSAAPFATTATYGRLAVHDKRVYFRSARSTIASFDPASGSLTTIMELPSEVTTSDYGAQTVFAVDERNLYVPDDDQALFAVPRTGGAPIKLGDHVLDVAVDDACLYWLEWLETEKGTTKLVSATKP